MLENKERTNKIIDINIKISIVYMYDLNVKNIDIKKKFTTIIETNKKSKNHFKNTVEFTEKIKLLLYLTK